MTGFDFVVLAILAVSGVLGLVRGLLKEVLSLVAYLLAFVAAIWWDPTDAGIAALATPALMLPRALGMRGGFDAAACAIVLTAAWSNVFDLYRTVTGWDLVLTGKDAGGSFSF